jgi:hypothetical protein
MVDASMTVIPSVQTLDEVQVCFEHDRLIQYRNLKLGSVRVSGHDDRVLEVAGLRAYPKTSP